MSKHAVNIGAPMEKQDIVGPFDNFEAADSWCVTHLTQGQFTWIISLFSPEDYTQGTP